MLNNLFKLVVVNGAYYSKTCIGLLILTYQCLWQPKNGHHFNYKIINLSSILQVTD